VTTTLSFCITLKVEEYSCVGSTKIKNAIANIEQPDTGGDTALQISKALNVDNELVLCPDSETLSRRKKIATKPV